MNQFIQIIHFLSIWNYIFLWSCDYHFEWVKRCHTVSKANLDCGGTMQLASSSHGMEEDEGGNQPVFEKLCLHSCIFCYPWYVDTRFRFSSVTVQQASRHAVSDGCCVLDPSCSVASSLLDWTASGSCGSPVPLWSFLLLTLCVYLIYFLA